MRKIASVLSLCLSLYSAEYFLGIENQLSQSQKILYGNYGANYYLGESTHSALGLSFGLKESRNFYAISLAKEYTESDHNFNIMLQYRPELYHQVLDKNFSLSYLLDSALGYSYKSLNDDRFSGSGVVGDLGVGLGLNYEIHSVSLLGGLEMDYTFTHTEEFVQSRVYIYYGLYLKLGYQYAF